jgi:hypothetical protein
MAVVMPGSRPNDLPSSYSGHFVLMQAVCLANRQPIASQIQSIDMWAVQTS